jgi:hypothetical protein
MTLDTDPMPTHSNQALILPQTSGLWVMIKMNRSAVALLNEIKCQLEHFLHGLYESIQYQGLSQVLS